MCAALGLNPSFIGKRGLDREGEMLEDLLIQAKINPALATSPDVQTNLNFNPINERGQAITQVVGTANASLSYKDVQDQLIPRLPDNQYLYIGGAFRLRGLLPHYVDLIREAHRHGALVAIDHGPVTNNTDEEIKAMRAAIRELDFYFPSKREFLETWGVKSSEDGLKKVSGESNALICLKDEGGDALSYHDGQVVRVPTFKVGNPVNLIGAGDSFNAGVFFAHSQSMGPVESIRFGCATAALRIQSFIEPTLEQVKELLQKS
jgi:ribokinase